MSEECGGVSGEGSVRAGITYRPLGVIHSPYRAQEGTPIQGRLVPEARGLVEVFAEYEAGLKDVEGFSHLILLYHFHLSEGYELIVKPFLEEVEHGVFAVRAPKRPNPIGLSVVRLLRREGRMLEVAELDIVDQTPLLDIKPYVPFFDHRPEVRCGWLDKHLAGGLLRSKADDRFS